jgi:hypothetical protein
MQHASMRTIRGPFCWAILLIATSVSGPAAAAADAYSRVQSLTARDERLDPSDNVRDRFGRAVAVDGTTVAIAATREPGTVLTFPGQVFIFVRDQGHWRRQAVIDWPPDASTSGTGFGASLALSGDTLLIGAPRNSVAAGFRLDTGAVYVYQRRGENWEPAGQLLSYEIEFGDRFGHSVALLGDRAIVGAPGDDHDNITDPGKTNAGAAYVFERRGGQWSARRRLEAPDAAPLEVFGISVALTEESALVGSIGAAAGRGAVHAFDAQESFRWSQTLLAPDGESGDGFGIALSADGDAVLVGAYFDDVDGRSNQGSAHAFARRDGSWVHEAQLRARAPFAEAVFGWSLDLTDNQALIGSRGGSDGRPVHVFRRAAGGWTQDEQAPRPVDAAVRTDVGYAVGIDGDVAVVGFPHIDIGAGRDTGVGYVFERSGSQWSEALFASRPDSIDVHGFGASLAVDGDVAVIGAPGFPLAAGGAPSTVGSINFFVREPSGLWRNHQSLRGLFPGANDGFGGRVAISGNQALITRGSSANAGSSSASEVDVYTRQPSFWRHAGILRSHEDVPVAGRTVAIDGDRAIVGTLDRVHLFSGSDGTLLESASFPAGSRVRGDTVEAVALKGRTAVIGVPRFTVDGRARGAAYVLVESDLGVWQLHARLLPDADDPHGAFGTALAIDADAMIVGAPGDGTSNDAGRAYVFVRAANGWVRQAVLTGKATQRGFGSNVALRGDIAMVSTPLRHDAIGNDAAAEVAVYRRSGEVWVQLDSLPPSHGGALDIEGIDLFVGYPQDDRVGVYREQP